MAEQTLVTLEMVKALPEVAVYLQKADECLKSIG